MGVGFGKEEGKTVKQRKRKTEVWVGGVQGAGVWVYGCVGACSCGGSPRMRDRVRLVYSSSTSSSSTSSWRSSDDSSGGGGGGASQSSVGGLTQRRVLRSKTRLAGHCWRRG